MTQALIVAPRDTQLQALPLELPYTDIEKIRTFLGDVYLPEGLTEGSLNTGARGDGTFSACSIAAINLALDGKLTDTIPACMSTTVGYWIIETQDNMPESLRNSQAWRRLLPYAAGTGRKHEREVRERLDLWYQDVVLPALIPVIRKGAGNDAAKAYGNMLIERGVTQARESELFAALEKAPRDEYGEKFESETTTSSLAFLIRRVFSKNDSVSVQSEAVNLIGVFLNDEMQELESTQAVIDQYWARIRPAAILRDMILASAPKEEQ